MSNQQQFNSQVTEAQYQDELSDFACLVKYFGARRVMKDLQVLFPSVWPDIYAAVVYKENKVPLLCKEWD